MRFQNKMQAFRFACLAAIIASGSVVAGQAVAADPGKVLTGKAALDPSQDAPGVRRKITVSDLPPPDTSHPPVNSPNVVPQPANAQLRVPPGFKIDMFAQGFQDPRVLRVAPNGDIFVVESRQNKIKVIRGDHAETVEVFTDKDLYLPFGIAFYPPGPEPKYLYVANTDGVIRFPYRNGDLKASGPAEKLDIKLSGGGFRGGGGGHWTRDLVFSPDGKKLYVSVGSRSNNTDHPIEEERARIFEFNPDGTGKKVYAWGIRNAVGIAFRPGSTDLWMSTNERDNLGEDLVPDYISRVKRDGFYGWPWFYIGGHADPDHIGKHPELVTKVIVPDVLLESHSASLNLCFYTGEQFPAEYKGDIFAALHGSWNRAKRTGYKIVRVALDHKTGKSNGEYEDFVTGFVTEDGKVWGRPVGVAVAKDGSLLFSEDGNGTIWRVSYSK